jgi:hypothetical protein
MRYGLSLRKQKGGMGMSEIDELLRRNEAYAASFDQGHLPAAPSRRLAIVTCMDARIDVHGSWACGRGRRTSSATPEGWSRRM